MTALTTDACRVIEIGDISEAAVVAADIIYEGAAVGIVTGTGHARPLTSVDKFFGFAEKQVDNSAGAAAAVNVRVFKSGAVILPVTGAVITDVGCAVYAQDENAFSFVPTSGVFIGIFRRFTASGYGVVEFNAGVIEDPFSGYTAETTAVDKTLDNADTGKLICCGTDAKTITLPAVAGMAFMVMNTGAYGTVEIDVAPNASDLVIYKDSSGTDNHGLVNTKATAQRQDFLDIEYGDATGWIVRRSRGIWVDKDNT